MYTTKRQRPGLKITPPTGHLARKNPCPEAGDFFTGKLYIGFTNISPDAPCLGMQISPVGATPRPPANEIRGSLHIRKGGGGWKTIFNLPAPQIVKFHIHTKE
jgi:hypothetical protein